MSPPPRGRQTEVLLPRAYATIVLVRRHGGVEVAAWPLLGEGPPDVAVVDELARWQLAARRNRCSINLRDACPELLELLELLGLGEVAG